MFNLLHSLDLRLIQKRPVMVIIPVATADGCVSADAAVVLLLFLLLFLIFFFLLSYSFVLLISHQQGLNDDTASVRSVGSYRVCDSGLYESAFSSHFSYEEILLNFRTCV